MDDAGNPTTRRGGFAAGLAGLLAALAPPPGVLPAARAQGSDARPVQRVVVPYPPGGTTDVTARLLSARASGALGRTWVIENRSGANGAIGADVVARAAPDGGTLLYSNEVLAVLRFVQRAVPFDLLADLAPIARTVSIPYVLVGGARHVAHPDVHALVEAVRRAPDRFGFAGSTLGSIGQLGAAALGQRLGVELTIVAYRGSGPALNDLVAGSVALMFAPLGAVQPLIAGGQLRAFASTSTARLASMPDLPTMAEAGFPDLLFEGWTGLWGPKGLPAGRVDEVRAAAHAALRDPEVARRLGDLGCAPIFEGSDEFARLLAAEVTRNAALTQAAGIRPE